MGLRGPDGVLTPVALGPISHAYHVDFVPVLDRVGIRNESYIRLQDGDLTDRAIRDLQSRLGRHKQDEAYRFLPGDSFEREHLLKAVYIDAVTAASLDLPFTSDAPSKPFLEFGASQTLRSLAPDLRPAVYREWISIGFPDFSRTTWDEIHDIRESAAGRDLRRVLARVAERLADEIPPDAQPEEVRRLIASEYFEESKADAVAGTVTAGRMARSIVIDFALNLIGMSVAPATAFTIGQELVARAQQQRKWVSLLDWDPSSDRAKPLRMDRR